MNFKQLRGLRDRAMKRDEGLKLLLTNFEGTRQEKDINRRRKLLVDPFFRIKEDVPKFKEEDFDWSDEEAIMDAMAGRFDMPSWAYRSIEGQARLDEDLKNYNDVFIYQLKACNLSCPYCYVDEPNKTPVENKGAAFISVDGILDAFEDERGEREEFELNRIRPSGGEPSLVPEQWLEVLRDLEDRGLGKEVHVQSDTNLTTGRFLDELEERGEVEEDILQKIGEYDNFSLLASFKGTDPDNFRRNTRYDEEFFEEQKCSFKKYAEAGIDVYPFFYNPNPETLPRLLEELSDDLGDVVYRKAWNFPLKMYGPTEERLKKEAKAKGFDPDSHVESYRKEWEKNFEEAEEVMEELHKNVGSDYKNELRVGTEYEL
ncbi:MAG: radical SAM protein [Candidatus Aenigmatarchaeota archaeon]